MSIEPAKWSELSDKDKVKALAQPNILCYSIGNVMGM